MVSEDVAFTMGTGNGIDRAPEVVECLRRLGDDAYTLRRETEKQARERWAVVYGQLVSDVADGFEIPKPEPRLRHGRKPKAASETATCYNILQRLLAPDLMGALDGKITHDQIVAALHVCP